MFGTNVRDYRLAKKITQKELALLLTEILNEEIKQINVGKWETGTNPPIKVIEALAEALDVPVQYLFNNSREKINRILSDYTPNAKEALSNTKKVALIDGYIGAGSSGILDNISIKEYLYIDKYSINKRYWEEIINAHEIVGDSMSPYVNDGDIVLYKPIKDNLTSFHDGKYIIETANGLQVKNLSFKANGNIIISSENSSYPSEEIKKSESQEFIDIRGIVAGRILKS